MLVVSNRVYLVDSYAEEFELRFARRAGQIDKQPGFISMAVMKPVKEGAPWVVQTCWEDKAAFDGWVGSEDFRQSHANPMPKEAFSQPGKPGQLEMHEVVVSGSAN